eukprot:1080964-Pelagomonas_calceolata.AAC.4
MRSQIVGNISGGGEVDTWCQPEGMQGKPCALRCEGCKDIISRTLSGHQTAHRFMLAAMELELDPCKGRIQQWQQAHGTGATDEHLLALPKAEHDFYMEFPTLQSQLWSHSGSNILDKHPLPAHSPQQSGQT